MERLRNITSYYRVVPKPCEGAFVGEDWEELSSEDVCRCLTQLCGIKMLHDLVGVSFGSSDVMNLAAQPECSNCISTARHSLCQTLAALAVLK